MDQPINISADNNTVLQAAQVNIFKKQSNQQAQEALTLLQSSVQQASEIKRDHLPSNATFEIKA